MHYQRVLPVVLSVSLCLLNLASYAALPINSVQDGAIIQGGTYGNTADNVTTFKNSTGGGLWLQSGQTLRGVEVDAAGNLTNNGGNVHLFAPGQVVRVDGNIDVRGVQGSDGAFLGNHGGHLFVDSAYLYQTGNIYADGLNGGLVQLNVGSIAIQPNARISAAGYGGSGGVVSINASGIVGIQPGAVINTSGKITGKFDTNVINIEGGLVNNGGVLQADGVNDRAGTIRLVATGQSELTQTQQALHQAVGSGVLTSDLATTIIRQLSTIKTGYDGDVINGGTLSAIGRGSLTGLHNDPADSRVRAADGGTILITAQHNVGSGGFILADGANSEGLSNNGGNGGTINLNAGSNIDAGNQIAADGGKGKSGGNGGLIAFNYMSRFSNDASIKAQGGSGLAGNGGQGGLIDFVGNANPSGNGRFFTMGGAGGQGFQNGLTGHIFVPDSSAPQSNFIGGTLLTNGFTEMLSNAENILMLARASQNDLSDLRSFGGSAIARTIRYQDSDVIGLNTLAAQEIAHKLTPAGGTEPDYLIRNLNYSNSSNFGAYLDPSQLQAGNETTQFNTLTALARGSLNLSDKMLTLGENPMGGVHLSAIAAQFAGGSGPDVAGFHLKGGLSGGSVNLSATSKGIDALHFWLTGELHGGSQILKAMTDIDDGQGGWLSATSNLLGGTQQLIATNGSISGYDLYTASGERGGVQIVLANHSTIKGVTANADGLHITSYGGYQKFMAGGDLTLDQKVSGSISANGNTLGGIQSFTSLSGRVDNAFSLQANGTSGNGGVQQITAATGITNTGTIEANGDQRGGYQELVASKGEVRNEGTISANGMHLRGGRMTIQGASIVNASGALIQADGGPQGGVITFNGPLDNQGASEATGTSQNGQILWNH